MRLPEIIEPGSGVSIQDWKRCIAQVIHSVDSGWHYFDMRRDLSIRSYLIGPGSLAAHAAHAPIDPDSHQLPDSMWWRENREIFTVARKNLCLTEKAAPRAVFS